MKLYSFEHVTALSTKGGACRAHFLKTCGVGLLVNLPDQALDEGDTASLCLVAGSDRARVYCSLWQMSVQSLRSPGLLNMHMAHAELAALLELEPRPPHEGTERQITTAIVSNQVTFSFCICMILV